MTCVLDGCYVGIAFIVVTVVTIFVMNVCHYFLTGKSYCLLVCFLNNTALMILNSPCILILKNTVLHTYVPIL